MNTTVRRLGMVALLITGSAITATPVAGATGPYLVKDIDTNGSSNPQQLTAVGSTLFFTATGGSKGRELFRSDGTPGGTGRVKDIRPGTAGSHPTELTAVGSKLFFAANDGSTGHELYVSDGTNAGTKRLTDINAGSTGSGISDLIKVKGTLFFFAYNAAADRLELWKSDGTAAGTRRVKQFFHNAILDGGSIAFKGKLYFGVGECGGPGVRPGSIVCSGHGLWRSNGSASGTAQFFAANEDASYASELARTPGRLYWIENSVSYVSDGTKAGTSESSIPIPMAAGDNLYFRTWEETNGNPILWVLRPGESDPELLAEYEPNSPLGPLTNVGGTLFFSASNGLADNQLHTSDGTPEGTEPVQGCCPDQADPQNLTDVGGVAYFTALSLVSCEEACDEEVWRSNGTDAGTFRLGDIRPGEQSSVPASLTNVGGTLYFTANDGTHGRELCATFPRPSTQAKNSRCLSVSLRHRQASTGRKDP